MALVLCVGATLAAASSFRQPGVSAPSRAAPSEYAALASSAATLGAAGTPEPTTEQRHPLPADVPAVSSSPTTACSPGFDSECYAPPPPTPAPVLVPTSGPAFTLHVPILEYHRVKPPAGESGDVASLIVSPEISPPRWTRSLRPAGRRSPWVSSGTTCGWASSRRPRVSSLHSMTATKTVSYTPLR